MRAWAGGSGHTRSTLLAATRVRPPRSAPPVWACGDSAPSARDPESSGYPEQDLIAGERQRLEAACIHEREIGVPVLEAEGEQANPVFDHTVRVVALLIEPRHG